MFFVSLMTTSKRCDATMSLLSTTLMRGARGEASKYFLRLLKYLAAPANRRYPPLSDSHTTFRVPPGFVYAPQAPQYRMTT